VQSNECSPYQGTSIGIKQFSFQDCRINLEHRLILLSESQSGQALSLRPDIIRNKIWAEELDKLVNAVGSFPDLTTMKIMSKELQDMIRGGK
jgi:hypothetical protein